MGAHAHITTAPGVHEAPCQTQQKPTKEACREYQAEEEEDKGGGGRGGKRRHKHNMLLSASQVLMGGHGGIMAKWTADSMTLFLRLSKTK